MFQFAREYVRTLPDECGVFLAGLTAPPEPFVPDEQRASRCTFRDRRARRRRAHVRSSAPVRDAVTPLFELVTPIPYVALQQMFNGTGPWGFWRTRRPCTSMS